MTRQARALLPLSLATLNGYAQQISENPFKDVGDFVQRGHRWTYVAEFGQDLGVVVCVDMSRHRGRHDSIFRRIGAAALDAAVLRGIGARWSYRLGLHGTLSVTTHEIRVATERKLAGPLVLAHASDFHAGATTDPALFTGLMSLLRERRPDVLLLGGDFVSWRANCFNAR